MSDLADYQTDHLFLLVGSNPLPNYVAASLLALPGGVVYLVHSVGTGPVAINLGRALSNRHIERIQVDEADTRKIFARVSAAARKPGRIGLNYTGGTKVMAVHAYRAIEQTASDAVFSYLDAGSLELRVHAADGDFRSISAVGAVQLTIPEMLALHGIHLKKPAHRQPIQVDLCRALVALHTTKAGLQAWHNWRKNSDSWTRLPIGQPMLEGVEEALRRMCGGDPTPEKVAQALGHKALPSCTKWFKGGWFEHYTLHALQEAITGRDDISDYGMDYTCEQEGSTFQFDVAAIRGYQLFAISCIASDSKERCKEHLFETFVRARQMGGDEARIGLVCCYDEPMNLRRELEKSWDAEGKIRVFGRDDLAQLSAHVKNWFDRQP